MSSIDTKLKYLFVAEYKDGELFIQPPDDRSINHDDTKEQNPSAFADVDFKRLIRFHLVLPEEGSQVPAFTVDLRDGHFECHGVPFIAHPQEFDTSQHKLKLYFQRETRQELTIKATVGENGEIKEETSRRDYVNRYFIGWEIPAIKMRTTIGV